MQSSKIYGQAHCISWMYTVLLLWVLACGISLVIGEIRSRDSMHSAIVSSRQLCSARSKMLAYDFSEFMLPRLYRSVLLVCIVSLISISGDIMLPIILSRYYSVRCTAP